MWRSFFYLEIVNDIMWGHSFLVMVNDILLSFEGQWYLIKVSQSWQWCHVKVILIMWRLMISLNIRAWDINIDVNYRHTWDILLFFIQVSFRKKPLMSASERYRFSLFSFITGRVFIPSIDLHIIQWSVISHYVDIKILLYDHYSVL